MIDSELLCFTGIVLIAFSIIVHVQFWWIYKQKNLKDFTPDKGKEGEQSTLQESRDWLFDIVLIKAPAVVGSMLLIIGSISTNTSYF